MSSVAASSVMLSCFTVDLIGHDLPASPLYASMNTVMQFSAILCATLTYMCSQVQAQKDLLVISDEVYHNLVFDGHEHTHIATLPGMWDRTLTVCR